MNGRLRLLAGAVVLIALAAGGVALWALQGRSQDSEPASVATLDDAPLPIPPAPPRIAEGDDYEECLGMLNRDPAGANAYAEAWAEATGADAAQHCHGLAQVALGNAETGAELLEKLAASSQGPAVGRAAVYGQAGQAWMMAGNADRAFAAATLALSLSSADPDLLIDRAVAAATLARYTVAIDDLNAALDLDPRRADALVFRGAAWRHEGQLDLAQDDIDRALALDADNPDALLERGILRQRHGDAEGARADWRRAAALDPGSTTADLAEQNLALLEAGPDRR